VIEQIERSYQLIQIVSTPKQEILNTILDMANEVRWIAIVSLALLAIVAFFDLATFSDSCKNIVIKGKIFPIGTGE
jgi:hypothetical protein